MTRNEARQIINSQGQRHTLVVYFQKANSQERRMVCRYYGASSSKPHLMTAWDIEKGAVRSINLDTVREVKVLQGRVDRPAAKPKRAFAEVKAEIELFY